MRLPHDRLLRPFAVRPLVLREFDRLVSPFRPPALPAAAEPACLEVPGDELEADDRRVPSCRAARLGNAGSGRIASRDVPCDERDE